LLPVIIIGISVYPVWAVLIKAKRIDRKGIASLLLNLPDAVGFRQIQACTQPHRKGHQIGVGKSDEGLHGLFIEIVNYFLHAIDCPFTLLRLQKLFASQKKGHGQFD
jgi:hypothetical protein